MKNNEPATFDGAGSFGLQTLPKSPFFVFTEVVSMHITVFERISLKLYFFTRARIVGEFRAQ